MIVYVGLTSAEKSNVHVRRHVVQSSRPVSAACFDTVIRVVRVVGEKVDVYPREDRG